MTFYESWINRKKKRDRDHPVVSLAYRHLPMQHVPLIITVEKMMPWEEERQSIIVVTIPPLYIAISKLDKYLPPEELECNDIINEKPVIISYITLDVYINGFIEGNVTIMTQLHPITLPMYTGAWTVGKSMEKLRTYMMSQETFLRGATTVKSLLMPPYMSKSKDLLHIASMIGYKTAFFNYIARDGMIPSTIEIATKHTNSVIFDDMIFGRYEHINEVNYEQYVNIVRDISEKTFILKRGFNRLKEKTNFGYILGSVYQFHTVYGK